MKFSYPCCNFILVCLALLGLLVSNGSEFVAAFTEDVHSKYSDQTQKAEARFTDQVDWSKVYEGVYNPTNVAIHNGQRFINYASATFAWFLVALAYNGQNKREGNVFNGILSKSLPSITGFNDDQNINSWYSQEYGQLDNSNLVTRLRRSLAADKELSKDSLKLVKEKTLAADPGKTLTRMLRSFADAVETFDGYFDEV